MCLTLMEHPANAAAQRQQPRYVLSGPRNEGCWATFVPGSICWFRSSYLLGLKPMALPHCTSSACQAVSRLSCMWYMNAPACSHFGCSMGACSRLILAFDTGRLFGCFRLCLGLLDFKCACCLILLARISCPGTGGRSVLRSMCRIISLFLILSLSF